MKKSVYDIVRERIIEQLENGTIPWRRPWATFGPVNWVTQRPYSGVNAMLLSPGEYATWNQIQKAGGKVKKGAKSEIVTFWRMLDVEKKNKTTGAMEKKTIPLLRFYRVWEISRQCEGLESKRKDVKHDHDPIAEAERIVEGYRDCPPITFVPGRAFYSPDTDTVSIPEIRDYKNPEEHYSTLFHELVHSTGHKSRLGWLIGTAAFGDESYRKEELIAEMGAAMLCGLAGVARQTLDNSTAYIQNWLKRLKENKHKRLVVQAASQAQRAADYIQGLE